ncbi:unnamed protein product [Ostreobium quekettii]|uniref:Uncharacterized protein n=1 Tax=Ostreobium quekettii TaxID=121088 RepID=A0A8S1IMT2_9CHLO|nr:unnamed protein product [Ostreobium quekettii]
MLGQCAGRSRPHHRSPCLACARRATPAGPATPQTFIKMRTVACVLLALVAVAAARELQQLNCKTDSRATLNLSGSGSGVAQSQAFCQAEADARSAIEKTISEYVVKIFEGDAAGQCTEAAASDAVTGIAKAVATAYTSVTTKVEIQGTGEACAEGFAAGDALAISLVDITLDLSVQLIEEKYPDEGYGEQIVKAVTGKENEATGAAAGRAVAVVVASAWAAAAGGACTTGGFESNFEEAFVESASTAIAELWATVVVELCSNFEEGEPPAAVSTSECRCP